VESGVETPPLAIAPSLEVATTSAQIAVSARKRFAFTIATNIARSGLSFITSMLVARALGPAEYGNLAFLIGTFTGLRALLDMGTTSAFFTFLSQRPRSRRFVQRFFLWMSFQFLIPFCAIALIVPRSWVANIWHGQPLGLVLLAFGAAFLQLSVWPAVQQACESQRRTFLAQGLGLVVIVTHAIAVLVLWRVGLLGLVAIFAALVIEYGVAAGVALTRLDFPARTSDDDGAILRKYVRYCLPLLPLAAVSFSSEFADRWLLQNYGGNVQQAFYAVGAQIASIALIATASILNIFWKEIAEAHHRGDEARTSALYRRVTRLLFFVGAMLAGGLIPWSKELLQLILGAAYVGGATTLGIMLLYPIHQSMGQIGATMMYATERVGLQVAISVGTVITGITTSYFVLAPPTAGIPGLGLASTGLAIKMVAVQLLSVNVLAYVIARAFRWHFDWIFQPLSVGACLALGWVARGFVVVVTTERLFLPARLAIDAVAYAALIAALAYSFPSLLGITRVEIVTGKRFISTWLARRFAIG
jgi:O-antigen/teichoic acid export membrane protein